MSGILGFIKAKQNELQPSALQKCGERWRDGRKYVRRSGNTEGKAQVRASGAALLRISLVPEGLRLWEMLARAARGTEALLLRGFVQASGRAPRRASSGLPRNTVVLFVPQQEAWVVERMGRFHRILEPGLNILIPVLDRIRYVQSLKEIVINVPEQSAVTLDNVTLQIDGVLYLRIMDPYKASYGVEDPEYAVTQLAQTTMRSELDTLSTTGNQNFLMDPSSNENLVKYDSVGCNEGNLMVWLSPGAARNGGSHLASAAGMDQTAS
nr:stomatin-like protein 2, mitochondrial [Manis javanica]